MSKLSTPWIFKSSLKQMDLPEGRKQGENDIEGELMLGSSTELRGNIGAEPNIVNHVSNENNKLKIEIDDVNELDDAIVNEAQFQDKQKTFQEENLLDVQYLKTSMLSEYSSH